MPASLARRYIFKLVANVTAVPVYLIMEALLPRALGPGAYGNYSFATNFFQQLSGFLDMGTSTCFYNALSRQQHDTALFTFYMRLAGIIDLSLLICGFCLLIPPLGECLMPNTPLYYAPLAALWALLTWLGRVLRSTNDALGATIASECWRTILSIGGIGILAIIFLCGYLNIYTLFLQQYLLLGSMCIAWYMVSRSHWRKANIPIVPHLSSVQWRHYGREFFAYSHPLLIQALLSFLMISAERWLLQYFDGSAQQGFYALSQKVSMACFLFVSAMTPLLMREFSVAWGRGDLRGMGSLLTRFAPGLYVLAAYFSCFTVIEAQTLVEIFGGSQFFAAVLPVQIMALYPLHQAYGQMAGAVFHASGKTKVLRNITACECGYGLITAWILLAPAHLGGLHLGAVGLAIKTVSVQFISVNLCLFLASRMLDFVFLRILGHQILVVILFLFLGYLSHHLALQVSSQTLVNFLLSGIIYTIITVGTMLFLPGLIGLSRQELKELARRFLRKRK